MTQRSGMVYLVGAGPGDPGLITVRGRQCLERAEDVLYDYLVNPAILELAPAAAERVCLGKHGSTRIWTQDEINAQLIERARQGRQVVRLKSGDPVVFARGAEEAEALQKAGIPLEIVPGVTAALAAGSCAGIPLTHRDVSSAVALVTGQERTDKPGPALDYAALARFPGTLAIYMGVTTAPRWTAELLEGGLPGDTPAALVRRCSFADQSTWVGTLSEVAPHIEQTGLRPPVIALVGPAARQRASLGWFEKRPLFGQRVLVTRPRHQSADLADELLRLGADVLCQPAIEIAPPPDWAPVDSALERLAAGGWDWLVFSSSNGVRSFLGRLLERGGDLRQLRDAQLAAVGPGTTAELSRFHLRTDLQPQEFRAEALAAALADQVPGRRVLLIRASRGREVLAEQLREAGAEVEQVVAYDSRDVSAPQEEVARRLREGRLDWVTVTSSAIARSLHAMLGQQLQGVRLASISPVTSATLRDLGWQVAAEARSYTMAGLVQAILAAVDGR